MVDPRTIYTRDYFDDGARSVWGGYARDNYGAYRDFLVHWVVFENMLDYLKKHSEVNHVIEFGSARGYLGHRFEAAGYRYTGFDVSDHCYHTRVVRDIHVCDLTDSEDVESILSRIDFDDCRPETNAVVSMDFFEHIPANHIPDVLALAGRLGSYGLHGINTCRDVADIDKSHDLGVIQPIEEWIRLGKGTGHTFVENKTLSKGRPTLPDGAAGEKINFGSFTVMWHYGWKHVDVYDLFEYAGRNGYKYQQTDITRPLPFPSKSVSCITTHHTLEHLPYDVGLEFLRECRRILVPGGIIRVSVPDARRLCEGYIGLGPASDILTESARFSGGVAAAPTKVRKLYELLGAGHLAFYDYSTLADTLTNAGFSDILPSGFRMSRSPVIFRETYDSFPTVSLFMEAIR